MSDLIFENGPEEKIDLPGLDDNQNGKPQGMAVLILYMVCTFQHFY